MSAGLDELAKEQQKYSGGPLLTQKAGGQEVLAVLASNFKGICTEKQLPESEAQSVSLGAIGISPGKMLSGAASCNGLGNPQACVPGSKCFTDLVASMNTLAAQKTLEIVDKKCAQRLPVHRILTAFDTYKEGITKKEDLQKTIDSFLTGKQSVAIGYSHCFLFNGTENMSPQQCEHSSVLVGRTRDKSGRCEYKLRDSFGTDCTHYKMAYQKVCDRGQVWVSRDELMSQIHDMVAIMPDSK